MDTQAKRRRLSPQEIENPIISDDMLLEIILMVPMAQWPSLELVNQQFRRVIYKAWNGLREIRLDEEFKFKNGDRCQILENALKKMLLRAPNILSIGGLSELLGNQELRLSTVSHFADFQHLESINLSRCHVPVKNLITLLEASASIKKLDISNCKLNSFSFNTKSLNWWEEFNASSLESLNIVVGNYSRYVSPGNSDYMPLFIATCNNIGRLEFSLDRCTTVATNSTIIGTMATFQHLSALRMTGAAHSSYDQGFHDTVVNMIGKLGQAGNLKEFAFLDQVHCDDEVILEITNRLPQLKSLELAVEECSSESIHSMVVQLKRLESLQLRSSSSSDAINAGVIHALVANVGGLKRLCIDHPKCDNAIDALAALEHLVELRILGVSIGKSTMETWGNAGFASQLRVLEFSPIVWSNFQPIPDYDKPVVAFINKFPRLRQLLLVGANNNILQAVASSCKILRELRLERPVYINAGAVQSVIDGCPHLKYLSLNGTFHCINWFDCSPIGNLDVGKYRKVIIKRGKHN